MTTNVYSDDPNIVQGGGNNVGQGGGAGSGGGGGGGGGGNNRNSNFQAAVDRALSLYPWMNERLARIWAREWIETGNAQLALAEVRQSPVYNNVFPGNRRDDGSLRMDETTYIATVEGYRLAFMDFGLNPNIFGRHRLGELIAGEVSPTEFRDRLTLAQDELIDNVDAVRETYGRYYGLTNLTNRAIFAAFVDPDVGEAILRRRLAISQIGAEGSIQGYNLTAHQASTLRDLGAEDQALARQFFNRAAMTLPLLQSLAARYNLNRGISLLDFGAATFGADANLSLAFERLTSQEQAAFTGGAIAGNQRGLTGLRPI